MALSWCVRRAALSIRPLAFRAYYSTGSVKESTDSLTVDWGRGKSTQHNYWWLRDNCRCSQCIDAHSGQKLVSIADVTSHSATNKPQSYSLQTDNHKHTLRIEWTDGHVSVFDAGYLQRFDSSEASRLQRRNAQKPKLWEESTFGKMVNSNNQVENKVPEIDYKEISHSQGVYQWLNNLATYGLCLIRGGPAETGVVASVAKKIAYLRETIYGETFDVIAKPQAENVAYTSLPLRLHEDLCYYESPPGIQLLHCIKAHPNGGMSTFADGFFIAEQFRAQYPQHFNTLSSVRLTFHKQHDNHRMYYRRPMFNVNEWGDLESFFYSPQFEGPLDAPLERQTEFYTAYRALVKELEKEQYLVQLKLKPGDVVTFNNRRVLHGRGSFNSTAGERFLQGTYIDMDEFASQWRYYAEMYPELSGVQPGKVPILPRIGNASY